MNTEIEKDLGLFEVTFDTDRGLNVKQFGEKDSVKEAVTEPVVELAVGTVTPDMDVPLTEEQVAILGKNGRVQGRPTERAKEIREALKGKEEER